MVTPRILLIGVGKFGRQHLFEWERLAAQGRVEIAGLVVNSDASRDRLQKECRHPVHRGFRNELLHDVDAVDIVTPASTHYDLVKCCLEKVDVLVEKPICESPGAAAELFELAQRNQRLLMAAHIYRFHPLTGLLRRQIDEIGSKPALLQIAFTNPRNEFEDQDPFLEWMHVFDLSNELLGVPHRSCYAWSNGPVAEASLTLQDGVNLVLRCGWEKNEKCRQVFLNYPDCRIQADYLDGSIILRHRHKTEKTFIQTPPTPLLGQLKAFLEAIDRPETLKPSTQQVIATMELAAASKKALQSPAYRGEISGSGIPRIAVVGAGVFGATIALELGKDFEVTLFERNDEILTEASFFNQWRHHSGFHYPRSIETILEVQQTKRDFEAEYEQAIRRDMDAYFAVSALGEEISRERYLAICTAAGLKFEEVEPPAEIVYPEKLRVCLRTDEAIVDIRVLVEILMQRITAQSNVNLRLGCEVVSGEMHRDGSKRLELKGASGSSTEHFDFLVNATYANSNIVSHWFGLPQRPLRFDRLELAVYRIPGAPRFMMTLIDAPFTSLTSLGYDDLFMLSHIHHSVLASEVTDDGMPPKWKPGQVNHPNLLRHGLRYLPILKRAEYVESRIGIRTVTAYSEDFDGRPTVVIPHGFGCWSVLGGKITTAVTNAREIHRAILRESATAGKA